MHKCNWVSCLRRKDPLVRLRSIEKVTKAGFSSLLIGSLAVNKPASHFYRALGGRVVAERQSDAFAILLPELVYGWADLQLLIRGAREKEGREDEHLYPLSSDAK